MSGPDEPATPSPEADERPEVAWLDGNPCALLRTLPGGTRYRLPGNGWRALTKVVPRDSGGYPWSGDVVFVIEWPDGSTPEPPAAPSSSGEAQRVEAGLISEINATAERIGWGLADDTTHTVAFDRQTATELADLLRRTSAFLAAASVVPAESTPAASGEAQDPPEAERWLTQTILHDPDKPEIMGNCWQACIASLLGLPLDEVPHFVQEHDTYEAVNEATRVWARERGLEMLHLDRSYLTASPMLCILEGRSPRGVAHAVIGRGDETIHDPHPSRDGLSWADAAYVFVPIDPSTPAGGEGTVK